MVSDGGDDDDQDTDTKMAILASLLEPATFPAEELLDTIQQCQGDVAKAAEALLLPRVKSAGKRKAGSSLESWLGKRSSSSSKPQRVNTAPETPPDIGRPSAASAGAIKEKASKPPVNLLSVLKQPTTPEKVKNAPRPALHLPNQASIDSHQLPLTLLRSPLSPALASALYLTMMEESETWDRNRFYLAGKWVESPHTVCHYSRDPPIVEQEVELLDGKGGRKATYMWSGQEISPPRLYPALLREAAEMIEPVVDAAVRSRARFPYEWAGPWRASVCGANRYDGAASSVGWHADQLTYLGPYTTIASLSLGTPRAFRLRPTDPVDPAYKNAAPARTYEVTLGHNSLVLMNAGCQERYKHTVPTQKALDLFRPSFDVDQKAIAPEDQRTHTSRINITFRFYREDFHPTPNPAGPFGSRQGTPHCKCGIPTLLRADQKAKARSNMGRASPRKPKPEAGIRRFQGQEVVDDDMVFFWQCQSPGQTGDMKGCGFFRILDMRAEGRGPCVVDMLDKDRVEL